ncbi:hypothetical protein AvCA_20900 [Azotobacter vinelandii CA]|uniref:Uncharacterized protein n=2 Tax=Azotobacter vinelandii TaxID=354 RepID=C1DF88_AZOVD|nr:hypothetical protein Avin_20900 [Azotobacter vinelandii DJ]AGK16790.1 hypothetical protein AvCA_20900 [Azotobacter vinelandii CA]AGK20391.1 hypothetical protein AvCA6_20900 [Azotobacter vinelandii CA6]
MLFELSRYNLSRPRIRLPKGLRVRLARQRSKARAMFEKTRQSIDS